MIKKILIADDLEMNREKLKEMLKGDYEVLEAENGQEVLDILSNRESGVCAVLLDIVMPVLDGYETLRRLRADESIPHIPVIMITGFEDELSRTKSLSLGANDFVIKPYNPDIIRHCLKNNIALYESEATLSNLQRDPLTGLYNRNTFFVKAEEMIKSRQSGYYVMAAFDVDKFKVINDRYGTLKGDEALRHIAEVFASGFNAVGGICCRISADDFAVLYPAHLAESELLNDIRHRASKIEGIASDVVFSIGRYLVEDTDLSPAAMYDRAMLAADSVRGRYDNQIAFYNESMRDSLVLEQQIITEMKSALALGQFEAWYQPIYNHSTHAMIGAEALARWAHPSKGLISPGVFIPVFEKNGFIYEMDKYIWEAVCRDLRKWIDEGANPLPVSVNISRHDILRADLPGVIKNLTDKYSLSPEILRLEITESAFTGDNSVIIDAVEKLLEMGFTVEIDDFGSGYSSLNILKDVPAQIIKLDMEFLRNNSDSQRGGNILESVVRMAKWLDMSIIAEGVETLAQADFLRSIGCSYIQGFLYSKPLPRADYEGLLKKAKREEKLSALETVENLDNSAFWDPDSMDTLIFNSYVGAACISEYCEGRLQILRVNEKYCRLFGENITEDEVFGADPAQYMDEENRAVLMGTIISAIETGREITCETVTYGLFETDKKVYLRSVIRVIARSGQRYLLYSSISNITAQREAEQEQRRIAARLASIMGNANSGISAMTIDEAGMPRVIFANAKYYSMFGYTPLQVAEELSCIFDVVYPEDRIILQTTLAKLKADHKPAISEYRCVKRDGSIIYIRSSKSVADIEGYGENVVLSVVMNITQRILAEQRALKAYRQLGVVLNNINGAVMVSVYDKPNVRMIMANDLYYKQLGYTREQYEAEVGNFFELFLPSDRESVRIAASESIALMRPYTVRYRIKRRDGQIRWLQSNASFTEFPEEDKPVQLAVITDITEQVASEKNALILTGQMKAIMDNVDVGITASVTKQGSVNFLFANDRYYAMLGYTKESYEKKVKGTHITVAEEDRERVLEETEKMLAEDRGGTIEYTALRSDGSRFFMGVSLSLCRMEGIDEPVRLAIYKDVTEDKSVALREKRSAEQLQAIMDGIESGIAAVGQDKEKIGLLFSNDRFYEIHGCTREQFNNEKRDFFSLISESDRKRVLEISHRSYQSGKPARAEYRTAAKEARWVRVGFTIAALTGVSENVHLCIFTDITAEKQTEMTLRDTSAQMKTLMDDTPGGFIRMRISPEGKLIPLYSNEGFRALTGMNTEDIKAHYGDDIFAGLLPEDREAAREGLRRIKETVRAGSLRINLKKLPEGFVTVSTYARITKDTFGEEYLNLYFADAAMQVNEEQRQKELLDNLPYGAALYDYDGENLSVIHRNKRYWELVRRPVALRDNSSAVSTVHPDDRYIIPLEMKDAEREGRDARFNVRILCGEGEYKPFRCVGRIVPGKNGHLFLYASYTPISENEISFGELVPYVLSAIMTSSSDLSFAKDKDFNYICASRSFAEMAGFANENALIGKNDFDIFPPEIAEKYRKDDIELMRSGKPLIDMVERIPSKDDIPHYSNTSKYILRDTSGVAIGLYGVGRDITASLKKDSQLSFLNDSIPGGLAVYIRYEDKIKVDYCNDGFCNLFGVTREQYEQAGDFDPLDWVFPEDRAPLMKQFDLLRDKGVPLDAVFKVRVRNSADKWINMKAVEGETSPRAMRINAILLDITGRQNAIEALRISEEENRLAMLHSGNVVCRFNVSDRTLTMPPDIALSYGLPEVAGDIPYEPVRQGYIAPESRGAYIKFFEDILEGGQSGSAVFRQKYLGQWRWMEARSHTVFSDARVPIKAVVAFLDVTEKMEKETVYKKWQQSLEDKDPNSYTLFRCNLNKDTSYDTVEGSLLEVNFNEASLSFDQRTHDYVSQCVYEEDKAQYTAFVNSDAMLAGYYRGKRTNSMEYREKLPGGGVRWIKLTMDLVEYPNSTDVEAYLMYEDINEAKHIELLTREQAQTDPLTGVLNRAAFAEKSEKIISEKPNSLHAMLMLDLDGFKAVNDVFGHGAGDETLMDVAASLGLILRKDDLVGRLGGDEFLVFLNDIPGEYVAENKAKQILAIARKDFSTGVRISGSVGIALCPADGGDFESLYKNADEALYNVKSAGKNSYAFHNKAFGPAAVIPFAANNARITTNTPKKHRLLIVEDNPIDFEVISGIFKDEFIIERAGDGASALIKLKHFGSAVSLVLLDLIMPGMNGFDVLEEMEKLSDIRDIPVIVVSSDERYETCLEAVRKGAEDFITKPLDSELLSIRVHSAISKAENERLRAKNSFLELRNDERLRFEAALETAGVCFVEYDWISGEFTYDPNITKYIYGKYNNRKFWHILLSDMVTDTQSVQKMQNLVHSIARDRTRMDASITVNLRTPSNKSHLFRMGVRKLTDEFTLADKIIITFIDTQYEL